MLKSSYGLGQPEFSKRACHPTILPGNVTFWQKQGVLILQRWSQNASSIITHIVYTLCGFCWPVSFVLCHNEKDNKVIIESVPLSSAVCSLQLFHHLLQSKQEVKHNIPGHHNWHQGDTKPHWCKLFLRRVVFHHVQSPPHYQNGHLRRIQSINWVEK
jgi:hypothetical protein